MPKGRRRSRDQGWPDGQRAFLNLVAGTAGVNVAVSALGSVGGLLLARGLGPSGRGDLAAIIVWPTLLGHLASVGLPQASCYWISRRPEARRSVLATAVVLMVLLGLAMGIAGFFLSSYIASSASVLVGLRVNFAVTPLVFVLATLLSALQATVPKKWNASRLVQPIAYFVLIVGLWSLGRLTVLTAVASLILSLVVQLLVVITIARRVLGPPAGPERSEARPLFRYGSRSILSSAPWLVNGSLDQLVLSVTVSSAALGKYAVAVSLSFLAAPVSTAFGTMAFPRIAATSSRSEARGLQRTAVLGCLLTACAVIVPLAILAPWVVEKLFGPGYSGAVAPLRLLSLGAVAFAANQVMSDILRGLGRPLVVAVAEGIAAVVTIGLLAVLIPRYGISGAALASTVAYVITSIVLVVALRTNHRAVLEEDAVGISDNRQWTI